MTLKPMPGVNDKAYTWFAEDFSEGEVEHTNFAIRFKTADIATHFKDLISYAKEGKEIPEHLKHVPETVPSSPSISNQKTPVKSPVQAEMQSVPVQSPSQTFSFKSPTATTALDTPSFSSFKFSAPTFGPGVFGVGKSPVVFGSATPTSSPFKFGQTATASQGEYFANTCVLNFWQTLSLGQGLTKNKNINSAGIWVGFSRANKYVFRALFHLFWL